MTLPRWPSSCTYVNGTDDHASSRVCPKQLPWRVTGNTPGMSAVYRHVDVTSVLRGKILHCAAQEAFLIAQGRHHAVLVLQDEVCTSFIEPRKEGRPMRHPYQVNHLHSLIRDAPLFTPQSRYVIIFAGSRLQNPVPLR